MRRFLAGLLVGTVLMVSGSAFAFDTRNRPPSLRFNARITCPTGHGKATVVMFRGFRETGGSFVGFRLTGSQTHKACS